MSTFTVEVEVALSRPPRSDATIFFVLEAENGYAAELLACQWAACHPRVVMPTASLITSWEPDDAP